MKAKNLMLDTRLKQLREELRDEFEVENSELRKQYEGRIDEHERSL